MKFLIKTQALTLLSLAMASAYSATVGFKAEVKNAIGSAQDAIVLKSLSLSLSPIVGAAVCQSCYHLLGAWWWTAPRIKTNTTRILS